VRKLNAWYTWLQRKPLWLFTSIMFIQSSLIWITACYAASWLAGGFGRTANNLGFDQNGHLDVEGLLISAGVQTVLWTARETRRRRRVRRQTIA
jgi:hypothetical protein